MAVETLEREWQLLSGAVKIRVAVSWSGSGSLYNCIPITNVPSTAFTSAGPGGDMTYRVIWLPPRYPFLASYAVVFSLLLLRLCWTHKRNCPC